MTHLLTPRRIRILIAEDELGYRDALGKMIRLRLGMLLDLVQIEYTDKLSEALVMSQQCDVSIIDRELTDSRPEETEAAIPRFKKPMIIVTSDYTKEMEDRCLILGAHAVFDKRTFDKLLEALLLAAVHGLAQHITQGTST